MKRNNLLSLALAVALLGAMAPAAALAQTYSPGRSASGQWDSQAQDQRSQDSRNDRSWQSGRADFEGRWIAQNRDDSRFGGNGRFGRGAMSGSLPNFLLIDQQRRVVRITDRGNNVVQVIALDRGSRFDQQRTAFLSGELRGQRLIAHGTDARGRSMTQTMVISNHGRTLIVRTEMAQGRSGRMIQTEKVYQRA
jgi:hypothetical protein